MSRRNIIINCTILIRYDHINTNALISFLRSLRVTLFLRFLFYYVKYIYIFLILIYIIGFYL